MLAYGMGCRQREIYFHHTPPIIIYYAIANFPYDNGKLVKDAKLNSYFKGYTNRLKHDNGACIAML